MEIQYQGLADEITPMIPAKSTSDLIGIFFTVDAMQCRKHLKKKGKQISRKLKQELILGTELNFRERILFMKFISRHFLAVVFEDSPVINFLDLKTF